MRQYDNIPKSHESQKSFEKYFEQYIKKYFNPSYPTFIPIMPRGKKPVARWKNSPNITIDMFTPDMNIALKVGAKFGDGYVFVIDFDSDDENLFHAFLQDLRDFGIPTDTVIVRTGGKHHGFHLYYLSGKPANKAKHKASVRYQYQGVNVEIFSHDHYVLIPPSIVEDQYRIIYPKNLKFIEPKYIRKTSIETILKFFHNYQSKKLFSSKKTDDFFTTITKSLRVFFATSFFTLSNCCKTEEFDYRRKYIEDVKSLYKKDFVFWMYRQMYRETYGKDFKDKVDIRVNLLSPIRREEHPSFQFIEEDNGEILGYDFGKADEIPERKALRIQEMYHVFKTGEVKKLNSQELRYWTIRIILDYNVWTHEATEYYKKALKFFEVAKEKVPKPFIRVFDYLLGRAVLMARLGKGNSISARWIERETGVQYPLANRALNVLVTCGLIEKTKSEIIVYTDNHGRKKRGTIWVLEPVTDFDLSKAIEILNQLHEYFRSRSGFYRFSRKAVEAIGLDWRAVFKGRDNHGANKSDEKQKNDHSEREIFSGANSRRSQDITGTVGNSLYSFEGARTSGDKQSRTGEGVEADTEQSVGILNMSPPD